MSIESVHIGQLRQEVHMMEYDGHCKDAIINYYVRDIEQALTRMERYLDEKENRETGE